MHPTHSEDQLTAHELTTVSARILVVEDDAAFAELVRAELSAVGHCVRVAQSVSDARQILRDETHPDLIVSDVRMPGGLGFELLWCERTDAVRVPVLLMSAFPSSELREFAEATGAAFLAKPFDFERLHAMVSNVLQKPDAAASSKELV